MKICVLVLGLVFSLGAKAEDQAKTQQNNEVAKAASRSKRQQQKLAAMERDGRDQAALKEAELQKSTIAAARPRIAKTKVPQLETKRILHPAELSLAGIVIKNIAADVLEQHKNQDRP